MGKRLYLVLALLACMIFSVQVLASDARPNADRCVGEHIETEYVSEAGVNKCLTFVHRGFESSPWEITLSKKGRNITGGTITDVPCGDTWEVTGGTMTKKSITIKARCAGSLCSNCAPSVEINVKKVGKKSYSGTFFYPDYTGGPWNCDVKAHKCN